MVKEGDRFKDGTTGRIYRVRITSEGTMILETEDETRQRLLILDNPRSPHGSAGDREG